MESVASGERPGDASDEYEEGDFDDDAFDDEYDDKTRS
jgi:hypothetical protein